MTSIKQGGGIGEADEWMAVSIQINVSFRHFCEKNQKVYLFFFKEIHSFCSNQKNKSPISYPYTPAFEKK